MAHFRFHFRRLISGKPAILCCLWLLMCIACSRKQEQDTAPRPIPALELKGHVVSADSMATPISRVIDERKLPSSIIHPPKAVTANIQNSFPALNTIVSTAAQISSALPVTASQFPTPVRIKAKLMQVAPPEVTLAKDMDGKDQNSGNFSFFNKLQGLKHNNIYNLRQDSRGNLWLGMVGGVTKFDGKFFTHYTFDLTIQDHFAVLREDPQGNMWFLTGDGLIMYDGIHFFMIGKSEGLPDMRSVGQDQSGFFWIGASAGGICKMIPAPAAPDANKNSAKPTSPEFVAYHFRQQEGFINNVIMQTLTDDTGNLWFVLVNDEGVVRMENSSHPMIYLGRADSVEIKKIQPNRKTGSLLHIATKGIACQGILTDRSGNLWIAGGETVYKYDGHHLVKLLPSSSLNSFLIFMEDSAGNIWISANDQGIYRYTPSTSGDKGTFTLFTIKDGLTSNKVNSVVEDQSGQLWFAGDEGLNRYNGRVLSHLTEKEGLTHSRVMSILEDHSGQMWFGTFGYGTNRFNGRQFSNYNYEAGFPGNFVWSMLQDDSGDLWFGSIDRGAFRLAAGSADSPRKMTSFFHPDAIPGHFYSIYEDRLGSIWMGGLVMNGFIYRYIPPREGHEGELLSYGVAQGLSEPSAMCMKEDDLGNLWIGTHQKGLMRYTPGSAGQAAAFTHYTKAQGFLAQRVWTITKDHRGNMWFGTDGEGVICYNGKSFIDITEAYGLTNNHVLSSLSDREGNLWFGTRIGLNKLPYNLVDSIADKSELGTLTERDIRFQTFTYEDGFLGVGCQLNSILEDSKGTIWVGANDRLTAFHPEGELKESSAPNMQLTRVDLYNETIPWQAIQQHRDSTITLGNGVTLHNVKFSDLRAWSGIPNDLRLSHSNNFITFHYIGIAIDQQGKVKYQYQLEGLDRTWSSFTSNTFAQYGNLSPGRYTFKVKAINSQRQWSQVSEYAFTIRPPWWLTWWAFALYAVLVAAGGFMALTIYKRRLLLRHQLKTEHDEAKRLRELDTFKSQLFTNLTHEFRTPLTVILGMARQLTGGKWKADVDEQESARVTKGLQMIENNGKNLLQLINQLLDLSKLENSSFRLYPVQSDIVPYVRYVTESFKSYAEDLQITLHFHADTPSLIMDFDPEQMRYVLTNLISNALKFTPPGGEVSVHIAVSDGSMQLIVQDTGVGIAAQDLPYVMDRFYQADSSNTRTAQGTGIGLAHTKELIKMMDGSIVVESELGKGTCLRISIPVKRNAIPAGIEEMTMPSKPHINFSHRYVKPATADAESNGNVSQHELELPQLLIIEDNTDVVEYLTSCFEYEFGITVAYDGKEGVEKAFDVIPDIIISDVMMPELDGFQVCDRLKQDERTSHIPIVLLTAKVDAATRLQGLRRGADAYVAKPFDPKELNLQIAVLLENRQRMAAYFSKSINHPSQAQEKPASMSEDIQVEDAFMQKVRSVIAANYQNEDFSLPLLCRHLGMSRSQLFRKLRAIAETTPSDMIRTYRLQKAKALLEKGDISVAEVAYQVGFKAPSYFSKLFQDEFGVQPSEIAK